MDQTVLELRQLVCMATAYILKRNPRHLQWNTQFRAVTNCSTYDSRPIRKPNLNNWLPWQRLKAWLPILLKNGTKQHNLEIFRIHSSRSELTPPSRRVLDPAASSPVRNGQASIYGSLECAKGFVSSGGSGEASIQVAGEGTGLPINALYIVLISSHFHLAFVDFVKAKLVQQLNDKVCRN